MNNAEFLTEPPGPAINNLYPALTQCFAIILCGYFAGRMNWVSESESKGMNMFVGTFSLPSLIFMSLVKLDLSSVNWTFLLSILVSKSLVFLAVIMVTLLVLRPIKLGRAGIFAIFCTQSNDFAIGYPLVEALYKNIHPEYASYLYLMAPINLAILNPIAFILMEIDQKRRRIEPLLSYEEVSQNSAHKFRMVVMVIKNVFLNPIVFMTILGILANVLMKEVPSYFGNILEVLGSAFSASSLFLLGIRMVGKVHKLKGAKLVVPGILIMLKLLVLPLVTREVISILDAGSNATETLDLSTYGFLYGTFPAAPGVFVFAAQYGIDVDLIASSMVACTFLSAPLMFVSAKMVTLTNTDPSEYIKQLDAFTFDISVIGLVACAWTLALFIVTRKANRIPHKITTLLIVAQIVACVGAIMCNTIETKTGWRGYLQFTVFIVGVYSSRMFTAILAVSLLFLQCRSLCYVLKLTPLFFVIGWGFPIIISTAIVVCNQYGSFGIDDSNPNFVFGKLEALVSVTMLVLCFVVTCGCLILHQRYRRRYSVFISSVADVSDATTSSAENPSLPTINEGFGEESPVDIEDMFSSGKSNEICPSSFGCRGKREQCQGLVEQYRKVDDDMELIEQEFESHNPQIMRHLVLLILLLCSMFVGLALCVWTLLRKQVKMSGIYVELSFLDVTLNFGQSIVVFGIFGLHTSDAAVPFFTKYWRILWYGDNALVLPAWHELSNETKTVCEQFKTHHLQNCKAAIASNKRWRIKIYRDVFTGHDFVDWLIQIGLARDRGEAVNYARHLIDGKVLKHINNIYHFYDKNLLYTFP